MNTAPTIATADLRVGMFVHLDLGWMSHPFALSSFRIADAGQIATIRSLGLARVRWSPDKSDGAASPEPATLPGAAAAAAAAPAASEPEARAASRPMLLERDTRREALAARQHALELCQRQYAEASQGWRQSVDQVRDDPQGAGQRMGALSRALLDKMLSSREICIRVLAETAGDRASHALNVSVVALLLGKTCGLPETDLYDLGVGALSHDVGKLELPHRLHRADPDFTRAETALYRDHVAQGITHGKRMGLTPGALLVIAQHHEHCDGSGFPQGLDINRLTVAARLTALANRYDNLCHPAQTAHALTPHEALSRLFTQGKGHYDPSLLTSFVRMMGVYPPGSVVQLTDDRFAVVDSVNSSRPLKPRVLVHDPSVSRAEPVWLDLESEPALGIRRSLPAAQLPRAAQDVLRPAARMTWFFEAPPDAPDAAPDAQETRH